MMKINHGMNIAFFYSEVNEGYGKLQTK